MWYPRGEGEYSRKDKLEGHETLFQQMWFGYLKTEKYSVYPGCNWSRVIGWSVGNRHPLEWDWGAGDHQLMAWVDLKWESGCGQELRKDLKKGLLLCVWCMWLYTWDQTGGWMHTEWGLAYGVQAGQCVQAGDLLGECRHLHKQVYRAGRQCRLWFSCQGGGGKGITIPKDLKSWGANQVLGPRLGKALLNILIPMWLTLTYICILTSAYPTPPNLRHKLQEATSSCSVPP